MIYPEIDLKEWCHKYDLWIEVKLCSSCGREFKTTVPVIIKGYAGLETPDHGCDKRFNSAIFTPISESVRKKWSSILGE